MNSKVLAPVGRSRLVILAGVVVTVMGAMGAVVVAAMLFHLLPRVMAGDFGFLSHQLLFQALWLVVFFSLWVTGLSLVVSGARRRRHDLVPGLTLYFLGAALIINGLLLLLYQSPVAGAAAVVTGALIAWLEWHTEVV